MKCLLYMCCFMNISLSQGELLNSFANANIHSCSKNWMVIVLTVEIASVCVGRHIELTCITNGSFIVWNFMLANEQGFFQTYEWIISLSGMMSQQASHLKVNSTSINFTRTSAQNSSPLISSLLNTVNWCYFEWYGIPINADKIIKLKYMVNFVANAWAN